MPRSHPLGQLRAKWRGPGSFARSEWLQDSASFSDSGFLAAARAVFNLARIATSPCSMKGSPAFLIQRPRIAPTWRVQLFQHTETLQRSISGRREYTRKPRLRARGAAAGKRFQSPERKPSGSEARALCTFGYERMLEGHAQV